MLFEDKSSPTSDVMKLWERGYLIYLRYTAGFGGGVAGAICNAQGLW